MVVVVIVIKSSLFRAFSRQFLGKLADFDELLKFAGDNNNNNNKRFSGNISSRAITLPQKMKYLVYTIRVRKLLIQIDNNKNDYDNKKTTTITTTD